MRTRTFTLIAVLGLFVAACSPSDGTPEEPEDTTTTIAAEVPDAVKLSYSLTPGTQFTYEVDMDMSLDMTTTGDPSALAEEGEDDFPEDMSVRMTGTTVFTHSVAAGPDPDTYEIHITGDFTDLDVTGTVDGEPVDVSDLPDVGGTEPIDVTVVVDEDGKPIATDELGSEFDLFGSDFGSMMDPSAFGADQGLGQFVGPPFSGEPVTVGDTWSETIEVPFLDDSDPITTQIDSEVVGTDTVEGNDVFVIETTSVTSAFEFDFAEILLGFMLAFVPDDASPEDTAELDALAEGLRFAFSLGETTVEMKTWFDSEAGITRMAEYGSGIVMSMDIALPDEETGELVEAGINMDMTQQLTYRLSETAGA